MTAPARFPVDVFVGAFAAALLCAAGVLHDTWFLFPLGITALFGAALVLTTWLRRKLWTHDGPTIVAGICVFFAFFVAFAVLSESIAEMQHVKGYGVPPAHSHGPWSIFDGNPIIRIWNRSAFPLPLPSRPPINRPTHSLRQ
jgi:hypothetical protein